MFFTQGRNQSIVCDVSSRFRSLLLAIINLVEANWAFAQFKSCSAPFIADYTISSTEFVLKLQSQ